VSHREICLVLKLIVLEISVAYLQTRRTSAIMYTGECSVPRFQGRFRYSDVPVILSLGTEIEFVYICIRGKKDGVIILGNTGAGKHKE